METEKDVISEYHAPTSHEAEILQRNSFYVNYLTIFLSSVGFSITMPSMWPYLKIIYSDIQKRDYGWVIVIFSIGQFVGGPLLGYFAHQIKSFKHPIYLSLTSELLGNYLYCTVAFFPNEKLRYAVMLLARLLTGLGAGNVGLTRAYITTFSSKEQLTGRIAIMSACQGTGFILGPSLQGLFTFLGYPGFIHSRFFQFNMYTACGYFGVFTCILNILAVKFFLENQDPNIHNTFIDFEKATDSLNSPASAMETKRRLLLCAVVPLFFSTMFFCAAFETILTPMTMDQFALSFEYATFYCSGLLTLAGIISVVALIGVKFIHYFLSNRTILACGQGFMIAACLLLIPFVGPKPIIKYKDSNLTGCPIEEQKWCESYPALSVYALLAAVIIFTIGFSTCAVSATVLFSKSLGSSSQFIGMGFLTSVGSSSRVLGPFYITVVYYYAGQVIVFGILATCNTLLLGFLLMMYWYNSGP